MDVIWPTCKLLGEMFFLINTLMAKNTKRLEGMKVTSTTTNIFATTIFFSLYHHTVLCNMYRKLDGLLWTDTHQLGPKASIQPQHPFVTNNLLEAVPAVLVHQLSHHGTRSLVLHPGFH